MKYNAKRFLAELDECYKLNSHSTPPSSYYLQLSVPNLLRTTTCTCDGEGMRLFDPIANLLFLLAFYGIDSNQFAIAIAKVMKLIDESDPHPIIEYDWWLPPNEFNIISKGSIKELVSAVWLVRWSKKFDSALTRERIQSALELLE